MWEVTRGVNICAPGGVSQTPRNVIPTCRGNVGNSLCVVLPQVGVKKVMTDAHIKGSLINIRGTWLVKVLREFQKIGGITERTSLCDMNVGFQSSDVRIKARAIFFL